MNYGSADFLTDELLDEVRNFREIAQCLKPGSGEVPTLAGLDVWGVSMPLRDALIGGDHLIYVDFNKRYDLEARIRVARTQGRADVAERLERNKDRAGILLADVAGHRITDAAVAAMLHQAFLLGAYYELETEGEITSRLFEHLKQRFWESTGIQKLVTMIYGEINRDGTFRFVSAGHPLPYVYSRRYERLVQISRETTIVYTPLGVMPVADEVARDAYASSLGTKARARYAVNEIKLMGAGDILVLYTDGLAEHCGGDFLAERVEPCIRENQDRSARGIAEALTAALREAGPQEDDVTFVIVRRD